MLSSYQKLGIASALPIVAAVILFLLDRYTPFKKLPYVLKQIIFGIVFGLLAVVGTEWGIPMNGAMVNCRDAAVLTGGLLFGAPAGIIAGIIGGVERWIAVAWGVGSYTRLACSASTIIAGFYSAALRKFMFDNKKPVWTLSLAIGVVMEVFHLTMVFITNINDATNAMAVVKACSVPMIIANGLSVMLATMFVTAVSREKIIKHTDTVHISQTIQKWLLICVLIAFFATTAFMYLLQTGISTTQSDKLLELTISDITADIETASDDYLSNITEKIKYDYIGKQNINSIMIEYDVAEISVISDDAVITDSTNPNYIGFDMSSGEQSRDFMEKVKNSGLYVQKYQPITYDESVYMKYAGVLIDNGCIQVGYDATRFQKDVDATVKGKAENRHVGKTGFLIITDVNGKIVSAPKALSGVTLKDYGITVDQSITEQNKSFSLTVNDAKYACMYSNTEGYEIIAFLPDEEVFELRNIALYVNTFMEVLVFAVMFAMIFFLIKRVVVSKMQKINRSLAEITGGNLNETVNVRTNEEFATLSDDINMTVSTLKHYIDEAAARIDKELEFAKSIQSSALPSVFPAFPQRKDFDIHATMHTAKEVGGDFYDFYITDGNILNFLIADVSGKGIPAAMFMMRAKTQLKSLTESGLSMDEVFTRGNSGLCEGNDAGMFVTAWQGGLNLETGLVSFANAGHNPPLVKHKDGSFEYLKSRAGLVLAGMEGLKYKKQELNLSAGDIIFLYTDGVTEATDSQNKLYGEDRLLSAINSKEFDSMKELCEYIKADVDAFVGDAPQFDDITMVALKYNGDMKKTIKFEEASIENIPAVTEFVEDELNKLECPMKAIIQINVAIDEIYSNIVKFAYGKGKGPATVTVDEVSSDSVSIIFTDNGQPYNPLTREDPDITLSAEERSVGGLGIYMVKKTMDNLEYRYENDQNILTITKKIR